MLFRQGLRSGSANAVTVTQLRPHDLCFASAWLQGNRESLPRLEVCVQDTRFPNDLARHRLGTAHRATMNFERLIYDIRDTLRAKRRGAFSRVHDICSGSAEDRRSQASEVHVGGRQHRECFPIGNPLVADAQKDCFYLPHADQTSFSAEGKHVLHLCLRLPTYNVEEVHDAS